MNTETNKVAQQDSLELVAKLMANENIRIVRKAVKTASFNIVSRELTLPVWKVQNPAIEQMFAAHEVGHALYTTEQYTDALMNDDRLKFKNAKSYLNVVEDVRIDKLMKRRYPGLRKVYTTGYSELADMDFFGVNNRDVADLHFLDRINIAYKVGAKSNITFSAAERPFIERLDRLETIEETIQLVSDLNAFVKQQQEQQVPQPQEEDGDDEEYMEEQDDESESEGEQYDSDESEDSDESDESDSEDSEDSQDTESEKDDSQEEETEDSKEDPTTTADDLEDQDDESEEEGPVTNRNFEDRVNDLANTAIDYRYWTFENTIPMEDRKISYKDVNRICQDFLKTHMHNQGNNVQRYQSFKSETENNVSYLIKEFEMRKAATAYKRQQVAKTGSLDMKKVWSYKLSDDLFRRVTTVKEGKNHGMLFLLDWSGSMVTHLDETVDQLINLVSFCHRSGIAYEVLAFTDGLSQNSYHPLIKPLYEKIRSQIKPHYQVTQAREAGMLTVDDSDFAFLQLFSSKMTTAEMHTMAMNLRDQAVRHSFCLAGTPLNEALVSMYDYIEVFQRTHNCEKTVFITLTDGEGAALHHYTLIPSQRSKDLRHFVTETKTKKQFRFSHLSGNQTSVLLEMIKARYNCTILGFYLTKSNKRSLTTAVMAHYDVDYSKAVVIADRLRHEASVNGYGSMKGTGRDELFIVPSLKINNSTLQVDNSKSARSIASSFTKFMNKNKTSRILLDRFIAHVA